MSFKFLLKSSISNSFGVMERMGFGLDDVLKMIKNRKRGIIFARGNAYGFGGPKAEVPGVRLLKFDSTTM